MYDLVQIGGSLLILVAFIAALLGRISQNGYLYLALNAVGSGVLAATAIISREAGFVLLEGVWALVSVVQIIRTARRAPVG